MFPRLQIMKRYVLLDIKGMVWTFILFLHLIEVNMPKP